MMSHFELFIANRYLRARRKEAVISVITLISILGVTAGVMALVIALAVTNGFRNTLQRNLLGAMAHINVMEKHPLNGIENWRDVADRIRKVRHVTAVSPALYETVFLTGAMQSHAAVMKGIDVNAELAISDTLRRLKAGSLDDLRDSTRAVPGIILGKSLVEDTGMVVKSRITAICPEGGEVTPFGMKPAYKPFRVAGIFAFRGYPRASLKSMTTGSSPRFRPCRSPSGWKMSSIRSKSRWTTWTRRRPSPKTSSARWAISTPPLPGRSATSNF